MKRTIRRVAGVFLTVALCMAMSVSAFAADGIGKKVIIPLNPEDIVEYAEVLAEMPPVVLGTPAMAEVDNSPNIQTRASGFLFSMKATGVQDLLVTGSSKTFVNADLSNNYLHITGNLTHTKGSSASIKIGGCYYDASSGNYIADVYDYVYAGNISSTISTRYAIAKEYTHRGFIKNQSGTGSVSGNLSFYSAE